jgi:hypothetical protein
VGSVAVSSLGGRGFKPQIDDRSFCFLSVFPGKRRQSASYYVTAAFFHVLSNLLSINEFHIRVI